MIHNELKQLIDKYCMGIQPTDAQMDEIFDKIASVGADPDEVNEYMAKVLAGPTREQLEAEEAERKRKAEEARLLKEKQEREEAERKKKEEEARKKAEAEAKRKAEEEARKKAEKEAKRKAEEEARRKAEAEAKRKAEEAARKAEEAARKKAEAEAKRKAEEEAKRKAFEYAANGHGYVDMGFGILWATCNIGATSESDYGDYFSWGETKTRDELGKRYMNTGFNDAARANWGGLWRIPNAGDFWVLSTCKITRVNGGFRFTSPINGNSVFFPAAGAKGFLSIGKIGKDGAYWTSDPNESRSAYYFQITWYASKVASQSRDFGLTIRPIIRLDEIKF